jgi:hypothetical protein
MLGILRRIHLHDLQLHFPFLMHSVLQSYCMITEILHFYNELCMDMIMNERAHDMLYKCTVTEMLHE